MWYPPYRPVPYWTEYPLRPAPASQPFAPPAASYPVWPPQSAYGGHGLLGQGLFAQPAAQPDTGPGISPQWLARPAVPFAPPSFMQQAFAAPPTVALPTVVPPTTPQPVWPPRPTPGAGLLEKMLLPDPPPVAPRGGLLDWVGLGDFLRRERQPRFGRADLPEELRQIRTGPDSGLFGKIIEEITEPEPTPWDERLPSGGQWSAPPSARWAAVQSAAGGAARNGQAATQGGTNSPGGRPASPAAPTPPQGRSEPPLVIFDVGPPTDEPVDADTLFGALAFDPAGPGQRRVALENPAAGYRAYTMEREASKATERMFPNTGRPHNNEQDAFRHALWSFRVTQELGPEFAKQAGDAHEISAVDPLEERLMDLYNNNVGRRLAIDPGNKGRPAEDVVFEALRNGRLQTRPFTLPETSGPQLEPQGIFLRGPYTNRYITDRGR